MPGRRNSTSAGGSRLARQPWQRPSVELVDAGTVEGTSSAGVAPAPNQRAKTESLATRVKQETLNDQRAPSRRSVTAMPETQPLENVGKYIRELVETITHIETLGINHVAGNTPKIVVVGDQSAGKSSVINAISGIQVPRSSGTCTRCPMQITLTDKQEPNAQWRCEVSIRHEFAYAEPGDESQPFYPWHHADTTTIRFKTVYNKNELREVIRRAQLAILNPRSNPTEYARMDILPSKDIQTDFSPNIVCLDISAPGLPNLSFYDLPGVIAQAEKDSPWLTSMVEALVYKYVATDNATVLLCCAMEGDIQNSKAMGLVYSQRAHAKDRTLGILTKPDRLPEGEELDRWRRILDGKLFACGHGFHVVKNPSQAELGREIDHATARLREKAFFEENEPWKTDFAMFQERFGTEKLQERLSTMLAQQILESLPSIRERVEQHLAKIDEELAHLPEPPSASDAQRIVYNTINVFTEKISAQIKGDYPENDFRICLKALRSAFTEGIKKQRPILLVRTPSEGVAIPQPTPPQVRASPAFSTPRGGGKRRQDQDVIDLVNTDAEEEAAPAISPVKRQKISNGATRAGPSSSSPFSLRINLDQIRTELDDHTASDIPGEIDPKAVNHLRKKSLAHWDAPTKAFIDGVEDALRNLIQQASECAFKAWKTTELAKEAYREAQKLLNMAIHAQRVDVVPRTLRLERLKPMTENEEALSMNQKKELETFKAARFSARAHVMLEEEAKCMGKPVPTPPERQKKINNDKDKMMEKLGPDPYAREVEAMSKVRAYYTIASMRFIDHICQSLSAELFEGFENIGEGGLRHNLITICSRDAEHCMTLLAEDPTRLQRRRELQRDRVKLSDALNCLQEQDRKFKAMSSADNLSAGSTTTDLRDGFEAMEGIEEEIGV
ncbi:P-loop containing nucleoside triphosphate hydrolase protein [Phyllosticta citrichinensis]|uniref:P-loop containing nucleoside triphosphate hydrolase protein n=1 Tax=Phyllosticta citrichinensis TaxID=1130410 RepID=A0ABR1Y7N2_9PEZI